MNETARESLFPSLRPEFVKHAAPEAIEAELRKVSARERAAARKANELMALLRERIQQIEEGAWPTR